MPEQQEDQIGQARQLGIWMVGLSGAAIGGALAKLDWLIKFPLPAKIVFLIAFLGFLFSLYYGILYVHQMVSWKRLEDKKTEAQQKGENIDKITSDIDKAADKAGRFHLLRFLPFLFGCALVLLCLGMLLFMKWEIVPPPPAVVPPFPPNKFMITNVPVNIHGRLDHSHTFLLNQQTGEVWELTCKNGKAIEFQRVSVAP